MTWPGPLDMAFMRHAFTATIGVVITGSLMGYFVVLRRLAFAAHTLYKISTGHLQVIAITSLIVLGLLVAMFRSLRFASLDKRALQ